MLICCKSTEKSENDERERRTLPELHLGIEELDVFQTRLPYAIYHVYREETRYCPLLIVCKVNQTRTNAIFLDFFSFFSVLCRLLQFSSLPCDNPGGQSSLDASRQCRMIVTQSKIKLCHLDKAYSTTTLGTEVVAVIKRWSL